MTSNKKTLKPAEERLLTGAELEEALKKYRMTDEEKEKIKNYRTVEVNITMRDLEESEKI